MMSERGKRKGRLGRQRRRVFPLLLLGCVLLQHLAAAATKAHDNNEDGVNGDNRSDGVAGALAKEQEEEDALAGYVNDFNMQHEASIPEDILDQRHIDEVEQATDDEDVVGQDQEFILESQRSTSGSFAPYDNSNSNKNVDNNNGRNDHSNNNKNYDADEDDEIHRPKRKKASHRNHYKNFKKTSGNNNKNHNNNNDRNYKESDNVNDDDTGRSNSNNNNNYEDGDYENTQTDSPVSSGSVKDDKLKNKQLEGAGRQRQQLEGAGRQRQQLDAIAALNERKFNKLPAAVASEDDEDDKDDDGDVVVDVLWRDNSSRNINSNNNSNTDRNNNSDKNIDKDNIDDEDEEQQQHSIDNDDDVADAVGRTAVGDIEESFANEDEVGPSLERGAAVVGGGEEDVGAASATSTSTPTTTTSTLATTAFPQFVGRKTKRHGGRAQIRPFNVAGVPNTEAEGQRMNDRSSRHHRIPGNDNNNSPNNPQRQQDLDLRVASNGSTAKDLRGGDDNGENDDDSDSHDRPDEPLIKGKAEDVTPGNRFDSASATTTTTPSAFEHHKAQRRNGRRSGHKSHKKRYKNYLRYVVATEATTTTDAPPTPASSKDLQPQGGDRHQQRLAKWQSYKNDLRALAKARRLPAASAPIFVVASRAANADNDDSGNGTARPYYEGQLSYYLETRDGEGDEGVVVGADDVGKLVTSETSEPSNGNWYRRVSPILRNGMANTQDKYRGHQHLQHQHQHQQHQHHHQYHQHQQPYLQHHHQYNQHHQHHHRQHGKHQQQLHHAYQRRLSAKKAPPEQPPLARSRHPAALATPATPPLTSYHQSHQGAMQELGHQITQMEEFDRYYRKWPHLARVQYQLNDENYRAAHPLEAYEYPERVANDEDAYEDENEDEEEDEGGVEDEDANLPPYIKKYNRRNKQLLNLLEGTLPPPTPPPTPVRVWSKSVLQPGPRDAARGRLDAYYWKARQREADQEGENEDWRSKDSFAEQRTDGRTTAAPTTTAAEQSTQEPAQQLANSIPGEDVDLSSQELDDWEKEIEARMTGSEKMRWQIERATAAPPHAAGAITTTTTTTVKPAVFRLPSYPTFAGGFVGKPRSRSAQFASSGGGGVALAGRGNGFISALHGGNAGGYKSLPPYNAAAQAEDDHSGNNYSSNNYSNKNYSNNNNSSSSSNIYNRNSSNRNRKFGSDGPASKAINNAFVYHRVEAAPRLVGAGATGHKQRLPFVAITDRRLETSKKALTEHQRDFEQNHYPMP